MGNCYFSPDLRAEKERKRELSLSKTSVSFGVSKTLPTLPLTQVPLFLLLHHHRGALPAPRPEERRVGVRPGIAPFASSFAWTEVGGAGRADVTQGKPESLRGGRAESARGRWAGRPRTVNLGPHTQHPAPCLRTPNPPPQCTIPSAAGACPSRAAASWASTTSGRHAA